MWSNRCISNHRGPNEILESCDAPLENRAVDFQALPNEGLGVLGSGKLAHVARKEIHEMNLLRPAALIIELLVVIASATA
jgi:hypothetical protein